MGFRKKDRSELSPPYVGYSAHLDALARLRQHSVPDNLTNSDEIRGTLTQGTYAQLIRAWRYLGLVNMDGEPEESLQRLVNADDQHSQEILREILESGYRFLFGPEAEPFYFEGATARELSDRFEQKGMNGKDVRRCVLFFAQLAQDAGIPLPKGLIGEEVTIEPHGLPQVEATSDDTSSMEASRHSVQVSQPAPKTSGSRRLMRESLISKLPNFDPGWNDEVIIAWLESYKLALYVSRSKKESKV
jgi:hypothetical protein